ncbi:MAG TPA: FtsQ-type POTRA domain-containing protein [Leptospiraceae bacterium]|nr:FtsQ-type POTRA domain-containing protein [Leptospiraceae bacterium]HRG76893.1 FtsQ-type POTRA domain-containing protein [Leptospiraceae bacterium]
MNEGQYERQWKIKNNRMKLGAIFIIIASLLVIVYDFGFNRKSGLSSSVNKLVITGHQKLSKEEIVAILGVQAGVPFEDYSLKVLEEKLEKHPRIKKASVTRRSKEQLLVSIVERGARFIVNSNDNLYEIDDDYRLVSIDDIRDANLVVLSGEFNLGHNQQVNKKLKEFCESVENLFEAYPQLKDRIAEVRLDEDGEITIYTQYPQRIRVNMGNKLESIQIRKLYASLAFFENQASNVRLLDLRGDDAVYH